MGTINQKNIPRKKLAGWIMDFVGVQKLRNQIEELKMKGIQNTRIIVPLVIFIKKRLSHREREIGSLFSLGKRVLKSASMDWL